jgi:hypothetical protein
MPEQTQDELPAGEVDTSAGPKITGDESGATIGSPGSAADAAAQATTTAGEALSAPGGYIGHNPDKRTNDEYTVAGVTGGEATPSAETAEG